MVHFFLISQLSTKCSIFRMEKYCQQQRRKATNALIRNFWNFNTSFFFGAINFHPSFSIRLYERKVTEERQRE